MNNSLAIRRSKQILAAFRAMLSAYRCKLHACSIKAMDFIAGGFTCKIQVYRQFSFSAAPPRKSNTVLDNSFWWRN